MQLLLIHSDFIEYEVKKSTPVAEQITDDLKTGRMEDALTAFIAVEKTEEANPQDAVNKAVDSISQSGRPGKGKPHHAISLRSSKLKSFFAESRSRSTTVPGVSPEGKRTTRSSVRRSAGTSLSRSSARGTRCRNCPAPSGRKARAEAMSICAGDKPEVISEAVKNEEKLKSYFYVMDVDGELKDPKTFNYQGP